MANEHSPKQSPKPAQSSFSGSGEFSGKTLIVADDEEDIRDILASEFEERGATVRRAQNGAEALDLLKNFGADLIISDIRMPVLDGLALMRAVHAMGPGRPVLMLMSGLDDSIPNFDKKLLIPKPFQLSSVLEQVRAIFSSTE